MSVYIMISKKRVFVFIIVKVHFIYIGNQRFRFRLNLIGNILLRTEI